MVDELGRKYLYMWNCFIHGPSPCGVTYLVSIFHRQSTTCEGYNNEDMRVTLKKLKELYLNR